MADQLSLAGALPMQYCDYHEWYDPQAYYTPAEIAEMLEEAGAVACPLCLEDMDGSG